MGVEFSVSEPAGGAGGLPGAFRVQQDQFLADRHLALVDGLLDRSRLGVGTGVPQDQHAIGQGEAGHALHLAGAATTLREEIGAPLTPSEVEQLDEGLAPARKALADRAELTWSEGQALSLEEALTLALGA